MPQHREVALQVHGDHRVPVRFLHAGDERIPQDAGIVDQDVESAELGDSLQHNAFRAAPGGDVLGAGDGGATGGGDLIRYLACRAAVGAIAGVVATEVVDDDLGAFPGEQQCVFASDATACAGDHRNPAF